jgi:hypothetical protein
MFLRPQKTFLSPRAMRAPSPAKTFAKKGSQRWLQVAVERAPQLLNVPLHAALGLKESDSIEWLSPVRAEGFGEYRDEATFIKCGIGLDLRPLNDFWPQGGPVWDGLARTSSGEVLLVEAKAHIPEIVSPRTRASEPARGKILRSIRDVQALLAPKSFGFVDWTQTFYQYTNRLAHLHFLRADNKARVHLINIYFVNATDVHGPSTVAEWNGAIRVVECYLGVGRHKLGKYCHKLFVDVAQLAPLAAASD